jgi:hypothetical protein
VVAAVAAAGEATSEVVSIADDKFSEWIKGRSHTKCWIIWYLYLVIPKLVWPLASGADGNLLNG